MKLKEELEARNIDSKSVIDTGLEAFKNKVSND